MPGSHADDLHHHEPRLVVGFDGSAASRLALEEAARRAGPLGHVTVVHAVASPPEVHGGPLPGVTEHDREALRSQLLALEDEGVGALRTARWEPEVVAEPAARAIARIASERDADAIYLGSRGVGRAEALLGSVSHAVLHVADRPVVVIPERAARRAPHHAVA